MADKKTTREDYNWVSHKGSFTWTPPKKKGNANKTKRRSKKG